MRPAASRRRLQELLGWLRVLVPTALLLVAPVSLPDLPGDEVILLDGADVLDGPLSVATQLARHLGR